MIFVLLFRDLFKEYKLDCISSECWTSMGLACGVLPCSAYGFLLDEHNSPEKIQKRFFDGRSDGQKAYENIHFILAKKGDRFNESYYLYI